MANTKKTNVSTEDINKKTDNTAEVTPAANPSVNEEAPIFIDDTKNASDAIDSKDDAESDDTEDGVINIDTDDKEPKSDNTDSEESDELSPLAQKIRRRKALVDANIKRLRNQPTTLSEQKKAARERGQEVMKRNEEILKRRKAIREKIAKQTAKASKENVKNMTGVLNAIKSGLMQNIRLAVICNQNQITRSDIQKLQKNNAAGWAECQNLRPKVDEEFEKFVK